MNARNRKMNWVIVLGIVGMVFMSSASANVFVDPKGHDPVQLEQDVMECRNLANQIDFNMAEDHSGRAVLRGAAAGGGFAAIAGGGKEARRRIELITADVEVGRIYEGKVARLMDFGAFVTILPGKDGLVHISQISNERVEKVSDKLSEGDIVKVKVLEVDRQGRVRLSMKEVEAA